jgi:hypothetical protein
MAAALKRPPPPSPAVLKKRQELAAALDKFVNAAGGWVISPHSERLVCIEALPGSGLSLKLSELGWHPVFLGSGTRVHSDGIIPVDLWQVEIPG